MAVNDKQVKDALRELGNSGEAPGLPVALIVAEGKARRRRRVVGSVGTLLVLLAAPYAVWTATKANVGNAPVAGPVAASSAQVALPGAVSNTATSPAPLPARAAPACPPASPRLVQGASTAAAPLSRPVRAAAGHTVTFYAAQHLRNASDRPILTVQLIVARPLSEWTAEHLLGGVKLQGLADLKKAENQVAVSQLVTSPGDLEALTASVPRTTAAGRYPVFMVTTWPGSSICGHTNQDPRTPQGTAWGQAGTLIVTGAPH